MSPYQHIAFNDLSPSCLVDFIAGRYHSQMNSLGGLIMEQLARLRDMPGSMQQEIQAASGLFQRLYDDLGSHLRKEEFVLYPYIRQALEEQHKKQSMPLVGSVLQQMRREHRQFTDVMGQIRRLTNNFTASEGSVPQLSLCLAEMQEFEQQLHQHIYLENNVLFPKLLAMEHHDMEAGG